MAGPSRIGGIERMMESDEQLRSEGWLQDDQSRYS